MLRLIQFLRRLRFWRPSPPSDLIAKVFPDDPAAERLFQSVFDNRKYWRDVVLALLSAARGSAGESWELRCAAVLLLEHCILRLSPQNLEEHAFICRSLGIEISPAQDGELLSTAKKQIPLPLARDWNDKPGTLITPEPIKDLVTQFRRRLERLHYLHAAVERFRVHRADWMDFLALAKQECRLTLARFCFTAEEVAARIRKQVEVSSGVKHVRDGGRQWLNQDAERVVDELPSFEAAILNELTSQNEIYWVSDATSSALNRLVEFPLTSAVLVIKPPGSTMEFELKRAGIRGRRLNVIYARDGKVAPVSHQLHGSSFGWLGRREAKAALLFAYIFDLIHGKPAPLCLTLAISSLRTVPAPSGQAHILDYLTSPQIFGRGFEIMRTAMRACVENLPRDTGVTVHPYPGETGLTLQFLAQAQPQQALLVNTSSFRLDRVALYLSARGPAEYFERGLKVSYTWEDERRLADDVLSEILGEYTRPTGKWAGYESYVKSALSLDSNRRRADHNFRECMQQIGEFWGTLMGVRGFTDGESFVARNVGLRSVWEQGNWRIRVIFMDHDDLFILGKQKLYFWPYRAMLGTVRDEMHVMGGGRGEDAIKGEVGTLREIYAVDREMAVAGMALLQETLALAYRKTQKTLESDSRLQDLFFPPFTANLHDWDVVARIYLHSRNHHPHNQGDENWRRRAANYLREKSYDDERIRNYLESLETYSDFVERMSFLYEGS